MRSDIDVVVNYSKQLEQLLAQKFAAEGRGLHEKVSSVSAQLNPALVKSLRWIATMRNKVVHENFTLPSQTDYIATCERVAQQLNNAPALNHLSRSAAQRTPSSSSVLHNSRNRRRNDKNELSFGSVLAILLIIAIIVWFVVR